MEGSGKPKGSAKERKSRPAAPAITDARFEAVQWDPRFQRFPKKDRHVEIDKRFEGMFKNPEFQQHGAVDKRGRKTAKRKNQEDMKKYYKLKDEDAWREDAKDSAQLNLLPEAEGAPKVNTKQGRKAAAPEQEVAASQAPAVQQEEVHESSEDEASAQDLAQERWARARGLLGDSSSSEEEEEDEDAAAADTSEDEEALLQEWGIGAMAANPDEYIPEADETPRLAIVDLDWDKITAIDILAVLRSFLVKGQSIKAVSVYPSDFGLQKMKEEAAVGPQSVFGRNMSRASKPEISRAPLGTALSEDEGDNSEDSQGDALAGKDADVEVPALDSDFEEDDEEDSEDGDDIAEQQESSDESGEDVDQRRLQLYERSRLRYHYAVVECQDVATATHLYSECDGMEFLRSACKLDMRFVPDDQSFAERQLRDSASSVPGDYTPPDFTTVALQHTNVKLTWDADDDTRKKALRKKMTEDTIRDDDFKAYLASSSSEEDEEAQPDAAALRERYRALLLGGGGGEEARTGGRKGQAWTNGPASDDSEANDQPPEGQSKDAKKNRKEGNMDMEVTFIPGLKGLGARLLAQKQDASKRKGDTVWEAYLQRRKEKKLAAKAQGRQGGSSDEDESDGVEEGSEQGSGDEQDPFFQHEDDPFNDPFFKDNEGEGGVAKPGKVAKPGSKKSAGVADEAKAAKAAEKQRQAQLEMLMMDDNALQDLARIGGKLQATEEEEEETTQPGRKPKAKVSRKERLQKKRDQKRAEREVGSDNEDVDNGKGFQANLQDPRFTSLFTSADYALDPTDPRFKQLDGSKAVSQTVANQHQQRQANGHSLGLPAAEPSKKQTAEEAGLRNSIVGGNGDAVQLKSMVASLKRKASKQAFQQQNGAKEVPVQAVKSKKRRVKA